jgi:hypothetical protein
MTYLCPRLFRARVQLRLAIALVAAVLVIPGAAQAYTGITITSPVKGATLSGSVAYSVATSGKVTTVVYSIDGVAVATATSAPWTFASTGYLDTTTLANGQHTLAVQAYYKSHSVGFASQADYVDNPQTGTGPSSTTPVAPPSNTALPVITGMAAGGQTLSTSSGSWTGTPSAYAYQWEDCDSSGNNCSSISGATGSTYRLTTADVGSTIRVIVTATNPGGSTPAASVQTATVQTATVAPVAPTIASLPVISGTAIDGQTLSASTGSWTGSSSAYSYQWEDCDSSGNGCSAAPDANLNAQALGSGDVGRTVRVAVTASNSAGSSTATSAATAPVATPPSSGRYVFCPGAPTFSGTYASPTFNGTGWWFDGTSTYWLRQYGMSPTPDPSMVTFDDSVAVMQSVGCHAVKAQIQPNDPTTNNGTDQRAQIISDDSDQTVVGAPSFGISRRQTWYYGFAFDTNPQYEPQNDYSLYPQWNVIQSWHGDAGAPYFAGPGLIVATENQANDGTLLGQFTDGPHLQLDILGQSNCSGTPTNQQLHIHDPYPFQPGHRYVIQEEITWGDSGTGAMALWIDGRNVLPWTTGISDLACGYGDYPVLENYRPYPTYVNGAPISVTNDVWYGGLIRGSSLADVAIP